MAIWKTLIDAFSGTGKLQRGARRLQLSQAELNGACTLINDWSIKSSCLTIALCSIAFCLGAIEDVIMP
jgi:hypothetical protein